MVGTMYACDEHTLITGFTNVRKKAICLVIS